MDNYLDTKPPFPNAAHCKMDKCSPCKGKGFFWDCPVGYLDGYYDNPKVYTYHDNPTDECVHPEIGGEKGQWRQCAACDGLGYRKRREV